MADELSEILPLIQITLLGDGIGLISGALLHGPTGVGKTKLIEDVWRLLPTERVAKYKINCTALFGRRVGYAESCLVAHFDAVLAHSCPVLCVIDDVASVCLRRDTGVTVLRVRALLYRLLDATVANRNNKAAPPVLFLASCRDPSALDPQLFCPGRLELLVPMDPPDQNRRREILAGLTLHMPLMNCLHRRRSSHALPSSRDGLGPGSGGHGDQVRAAPSRKGTKESNGGEGEAAVECGGGGRGGSGGGEKDDRDAVCVEDSGDGDESVEAARAVLLDKLARRTHGFVGADLEHLCREALLKAMATAADAAAAKSAAVGPMATEEQEGWEAERAAVVVGSAAFDHALAVVRPSGAATDPLHVPAEPDPATCGVHRLGGLDAVWARLRLAVLAPLKACTEGGTEGGAGGASGGGTAAVLAALGLPPGPPRGVMVSGPPGCGKTALCLALAAALRGHCRFLHVPCTALVGAEVGSSERRLAAVFAAARKQAPCVILLDQIECIAARRSVPGGAEKEEGGVGGEAPGGEGHAAAAVGGSPDAAAGTMDRILSLLLVELDGAQTARERGAGGGDGGGSGVVVLATTPDQALVDPALLRPGRLDQHVRLTKPGPTARADILNRYMSRMPLALSAHRAAGGGGSNSSSSSSSGGGGKGDRGGGEGGSGGGTAFRHADLVMRLAYATEGWTGAELAQLCQEAAVECLRCDIAALGVTERNFEHALACRGRSLLGAPSR